MSSTDPSPEELQRELEQVRAAEPALNAAPQPSILAHLWKWAFRGFLIWVGLVVLFLTMWFVLNR